MAQRFLETGMRRQSIDAQQANWCGIGIHAVAAASLFRRPGAKPVGVETNRPAAPERQQDLATD